MNDLGVTSNGSNNTLSVTSSTLNDALTNNLDAVKSLFTAPTTGLGATLGAYLNDTNGSNGVLATKETNLTNESNDITTSISAMETRITSDQNEMDAQFVQMETAISSINTQKEYLAAVFGTSGASNTSGATSAASSSSSGL